MTLKEKIEEMIDILSIIPNITSLVLDKTKNYYRIPKNINDWSNLFINNVEKSILKIKSRAQPIILTRAFAFVDCELLDIEEVDTSQCLNWDNCFLSKSNKRLREIRGNLNFQQTKNLDNNMLEGIDTIFKGCQYLEELRLVENSFDGYWNWLDFSDSPNLSEDTLLSIANSIDPTNLIKYNTTTVCYLNSEVIRNMPQYIKDVFIEKRCDLA